VTTDFDRELDLRLEDWADQGLMRELDLARGHDFSSNDYLGLSQHPAIADALIKALGGGIPTGSTGSRLLRGHHRWHQRTEEALARFLGRPRTLAFSSGYAANMGVLESLCRPEDQIFSDQFNHASLIDGIRQTRATRHIFRHNDLDHLEQLIRCAPAGRRFIVTESVFSMEGDLAPLDDIAVLARRYACRVILDEAHATGVFGTGGQGRFAEVEWRDVPLVTMHTCGKALGSSGAFVGCSPSVQRYLINHARKFVFSTAPSPLLMVQWQAALDVIHAEPQLRRKIHENMATFRDLLHSAGIEAGRGSQIVILVLGNNRRALGAAKHMQSCGFDVRAIRYPTVPRGTSRLRITLNAKQTPALLEQFVHALQSWFAQKVAHA